jgi:hypothetical protein
MQRQLSEMAKVVILMLCSSMSPLHAHIAVTAIQKTAGIMLGAVALATAIELSTDMKKYNKMVCNALDNVEKLIGSAVWFVTIPMIPAYVMDSHRRNALIRSKDLSIAARLWLCIVAGCGSYVLLKSSKNQDKKEKRYA